MLIERRHDGDDDGSKPLSPFTSVSDDEFRRLQDELLQYPDRAVAILGATFIESRVRDVIQSKLAVCDKQSETLLGTDEKLGRLGLADQCDLAYALGAFGPKTLSQLKTIGRIRNKFAHRTEVSFESPPVSDMCLELPYGGLHFGTEQPEYDAASSKMRYVGTVNFIYFALWCHMDNPAKFTLP